MDEATEARIIDALEKAFPSSPLNVMARTINKLAETLPKDHPCESIFEDFDRLGEYVRELEETIDARVARSYHLGR